MVNLKQRRLELGLTMAEVAKAIGVSEATVSRYESGNIKNMRRDRVAKYAKVLCVNPSEFIIEEDEMNSTQDDLSTLMQKFDNIRPVKLKKFPLLGEIACGEPIFADEDRESFIMADMDIRADFCLRAKGDSMVNADIFEGDIVFIRKQPIVDNGEIAAVIIDDEATLKRVYYNKSENYLQLVSENPKYDPFVYTGERLNEIQILGKAVFVLKKL